MTEPRDELQAHIDIVQHQIAQLRIECDTLPALLQGESRRRLVLAQRRLVELEQRQRRECRI